MLITTAIIAFREFLEGFLFVGIFIGMDKKFQLGKRKEILLATVCGCAISLVFPVIVFFFASNLAHSLTETDTDIIEGHFLTFAGFFLAYVIFSLHNFMKSGKKKLITDTNEKLKQEIFDVSLFFTIIFFIAREGFEVALLIATTSLFSVFWTNIEGLFIGFLCALSIGLVTSCTYITLPIKRVFQYTEYFIVIIGAAMVKNGLSLLLTNYLQIHLQNILPIRLHFLPNDATITGHILNNLFGIQREMSVVQLGTMGVYIFLVWYLFGGNNQRAKHSM